MPALYKEYRDEVHVFPHRSPRKHGGAPFFFWNWLRALGSVFFAMAIFGGIRLHYHQTRPYLLLFCTMMFLLLFGAIVSGMRKLVFSSRTRKVYRAFLFFRYAVASFDDLSGIALRHFKTPNGELFLYVAVWCDVFRGGIHLSPVTIGKERQAGYAQIMPRLAHMLQSARQAESDDVPDILMVNATFFTPGEEDAEAPRALRRRGGLPGNSFIVSDILFFLFYSAIVFAFLFICNKTLVGDVGSGDHTAFIIGLWIAQVCVMAFFFGLIGKTNADVAFDRERRVVLYRTWFGMKRNEIGFDCFQRFFVHESFGRVLLGMEFEGVDVAIGACASRSSDTARACFYEICEILGLDPEGYLKTR